MTGRTTPAAASEPAIQAHPRPHPVALRNTIRRAFQRGGTDERGSFRVDQILVERLGRDADSVGDVGEFQFPEQLKEGGLVKSDRAVSFREIPRQFSLTIARWLTTSTMRRSTAESYTTPGDVTLVQ